MSEISEISVEITIVTKSISYVFKEYCIQISLCLTACFHNGGGGW